MRHKKDLFRPFVTSNVSFEKISKGIIGENKELYFDYTASGLGYAPIEERLQEVLSTYANTHSEFSNNAKTTSYYYEQARENLKISFGLGDEFALFPCGTGATGAIKKFQELMGIYLPPATKKRFNLCLDTGERPLVLIGPFEHHSNEISYREALCDVIRIPLDKTGNVDLEYLQKILEEQKGREIIGAFSTASNVTGIISPYKQVSNLLRKYNALIAFDSAASSPCLHIEDTFFDVLFLSPHKLLGGPGSCGLLAIRKKLIDKNDSPTFAGGGTVTYVSSKTHNFNDNLEIREDAGTPAILQLIKASFAYQLRDEIGLHRIQSRKIELFDILIKGIEEINDVIIYGVPDEHKSIGILAMNVKGIDPFILCETLSEEFEIQTRAGCSCAGPYGHDLFGIEKVVSKDLAPSWLRISVNYTHNKKSVEFLIFAIKASVKYIKGEHFIEDLNLPRE